jgi:uncharacterized repeat protein (TIGR02543 family)
MEACLRNAKVKKLLLGIFTIFMLASMTTCGALLFTGCSGQQFVEDVTAPETEDEKSSVDEETPSVEDESSDDLEDDEEITANATYYFFNFGGARVTDTQFPESYESTGSGTDWYFGSYNNTACGTVTVSWSGGSTTNKSISTSSYEVAITRTVSTSTTFTFSYTANAGYKFIGWWYWDYNASGADGGETWFQSYSTSDTMTLTTSGSSWSVDASYCAVFYYGDIVANPNNGTISTTSYGISNVEVTSTSSYSFSLNSSGWWQSGNAGVNNSYSYAIIHFTATASATLNVQVINYAEANYDYGIFSAIDSSLSWSYSADTSYYWRGYGNNSSSIQTITYTGISAGNHYICVKFRKDGSSSKYNDSLQFFVENDWQYKNYYYRKSPYIGQRIGTLPTATRSGYTFNGWWTALSGGTQVTEDTLQTGGQIIYAHWIANTYTINIVRGDAGIYDITNPATSWNYNGGNVVGGGKTVTYNYGSSYTISVSVNSGYTFSKWSDGSTSASRTITVTGDATYIAYTTALSYTVYLKYNYDHSSTSVWNSKCTTRTLTNLSYNSGASQYSNTNTNVSTYTSAFIGDNLSTYRNIIILSGSSNSTLTCELLLKSTITYIYFGLNSSSGVARVAASTSNLTVGCVYTLSATFNATGYILNIDVAQGGSSASGDEFKTVTYNSTYGTLTTPTRSNYTFLGWYTAASDGTKVTSTDTYTTVGDSTLYAHWTPTAVTVRVTLCKISKDGKTVTIGDTEGGYLKITYYYADSSSATSTMKNGIDLKTATGSYSHHAGQIFIMLAYPNSNYKFVGYSTSSSPDSSIKNPTTSKATSRTKIISPTASTSYYVYFKEVSGMQLKYDSVYQYYYFENGEYPQSYAGSFSTVNTEATLSANGDEIAYIDGNGKQVELPVYVNSNGRYLVVTASSNMTLSFIDSTKATKTVDFVKGERYCFLFEPIRWRISDYGVEDLPEDWSTYTAYHKSFNAVSDLILGFGAMNSTTDVKEGTLASSLEGFSLVQSASSVCELNLSDYNALTSSSVIEIDQYNGTDSGNAVDSTTVSYSSPLRIASMDEINACGSATDSGNNTVMSDKSAKASDLVAFMLGTNNNKASYWTRDLYNLGAGVAVTASGTTTNAKLTRMMGMRFAYSFSEGSYVGL